VTLKPLVTGESGAVLAVLAPSDDLTVVGVRVVTSLICPAVGKGVASLSLCLGIRRESTVPCATVGVIAIVAAVLTSSVNCVVGAVDDVISSIAEPLSRLDS